MFSHGVSVRMMVAAAVVGAASLTATPSSAAAQSVPGGSYTQSCRNSSMSRDGVLYSECRNNLALWHRTSIRPSDCRNQDIANQNGSLVCADLPSTRGNGRDRDGDDHGRWSRDRGDDDGYGRGNNGRGRGHGYGRGKGHRDDGGITLYAGRRFSGKSMYIGQDYTNLGSTGFNDLASSVRIEGGGTWRLCSDKNYGGRCVNVTGSTADLGRLGLGNNVSSIRRVD